MDVADGGEVVFGIDFSGEAVAVGFDFVGETFEGVKVGGDVVAVGVKGL